jgi:hypothetical protein
MFHSIPKKESTVVPPVREKIEKSDPLHHSATTSLSLSVSLSLHATTSILPTLLTVTGRKEREQLQ